MNQMYNSKRYFETSNVTKANIETHTNLNLNYDC